MQAGFVMLETGGCGLNAMGMNHLIRMKIADTCISVLAFWLLGYRFQYGEGNEYIGWYWGSAAKVGNPKKQWMFNFAFAANAATIVTGAVVGRTKLSGYLIGS